MKKEPKNIDPNELTVHPLAKRLPDWSKDDPRYISLLEDIRARGIDRPLLVDPENRILDGRTVWRAAKQLQMKEVPVQVMPADQSAAVVLHSLVNRKHYSKGALAYASYTLFAPVLEESRKRQIANLKNGKTPINSRESIQSTLGAKRVDELAEALGFRRDQYYQAKELHAKFEEADREIAEWEAAHPNAGADDPGRPVDLRAKFEPEILKDEKPMGLGAALAGIAGLKATGGQPREDSGQLELFTDAFETLEKRFRYWESFDERAKNLAVPAVRGFVKRMPADLRKEFAKALKEAERGQ